MAKSSPTDPEPEPESPDQPPSDVLSSPEGVPYQQPSRPQGQEVKGENPEKLRLERMRDQIDEQLATFG